MKSAIFTLILGLLFLVGCTPTNENLTSLTGGETTTTKNTTINGPLGNSALAYSPSSKDFGTLAANSGNSSQSFTVTNTSAYTVYLGTLTGATSDFTVTANSCSNGFVMTPNAFCTITVQFAPLTTGNLSTAFALPYDTTLGGNSFSSSVGVNGAGTTLTGFSGLTTISAINATDMTLNWTDAGVNAGSYQTYEINATGGAILIGNLTRASVCTAGSCAAQVTGLNPSTAYTFRVRATDTNHVQEQNIVNQSATTLAGNLDLWMSSSSTAAGICLLATITTESSTGAALNMTTPSTISITGKGSGSLYSNATCTTTLSNPTIALGTSAAIFYFKDTLKESLTLSASLSTYAGDTHALTINPADADHLVLLSGNNQTATVNTNLATSAAVQVVDFYGNGVSGINLSVFDWYGVGGQPHSTILTTDANGRASTGITIGSIDLKDTFVVERTGTVLPDVAASGNPRLFFTETTSTTGTGIFAGFNITGTNPVGGASGDFNGDGKLDMVSANYSSNTVSVFLGNNNGTFATKVDYTTGTGPNDMIVGYFNADAFLDIATANYGANTISILLGVGNGTFSAKVDYATGASPYGVTSGDYDGDGDIDIATANYASATISVFLGVGNGTYAAKVDYASGNNPLFLTTADINGDGAKDILTPNYGSNTFSVFRNNNNGTGTFAAKVDYTVGTNPYHIQTALLNSDAYVDVVVTNYGSNTVSIFLGNAGGTFPARVDYGTAATPSYLDIFDYNGDSYKDLVVAGYTSNTISIFAGVGDGTFATKVDLLTGGGTNPYKIFSGDFNADSKRDIVASYYSSTSLVLLMGTGTSFKLPTRAVTTGSNTYDQVTGDLNRDGNIDLISVNYGSNSISVLMGQGSGKFASKVDYTTNTNPSCASVADFNGDGHLDIVVNHFGIGIDSVGIFLGAGDGTFGARVDYTTGARPFRNIVADLNGDGRMDIATENYSSNNISVLLGNGDGTFAAHVTYTTGTGPHSIAVGDFNNDKKLDLATVNYSVSTLSVFIGAGNGTFAAKVDYATGTNPTGIKIGDMNGDNYHDLIVADYGGATMSILLNNGNGTFAARTSYATGTNPYNPITGDFNSDGKLDLLMANYSSGTISFFAGTGTGTVSAKVDYKLSAGTPIDVYTADIDGDGKLDIITSTNAAYQWIIPGL